MMNPNYCLKGFEKISQIRDISNYNFSEMEIL